MKFGKTWWGQEWLAAFNGIDYSNRLPRGRSYAAKGSVAELVINDQQVVAKVKGSRRQPYTVTVRLSVFSQAEKKQVLKLLDSSPPLLSHLLNRQLPTELLSELETKGIQLFPENWQYMNAHCSCPDWAVPCKHIAATLYLVANEIDKNPFEVFRLHGMDLITEVERHLGVTLRALSEPKLCTVPWQPEPQVLHKEDISPNDYAEFDLSTIPDLSERIFNILSSQTLFHDKSFHPILRNLYKKSARAAVLFSADETPHWPLDEQYRQLKVMLDHQGKMTLAHNESGLVSLAEQSCLAQLRNRSKDRPIKHLTHLLRALRETREEHLSPNLLLWRQIYQLAIKLVQKQAYVPCAHYNRDKALLIHWLPAPFSTEVTERVEQLIQACPSDLIIMQQRLPRRKTDTAFYADAKNQIEAALNLFIGFFMTQGFNQATDAQQKDDICQLFCLPEAVVFDRFDNQAQPKVIYHWLSPLYLSQRPHQMIIQIDEVEHNPDQFNLLINIEHDNNLQPLSKLLTSTKLSATKINVLTDLALLTEYFPDLERLYEKRPARWIELNLAELTPVLQQILPALRALGIHVVLPKSLQKLASPQLNLALKAESVTHALTYLNMTQLLSFDWQIAVGELRLSIEEFRQLQGNTDGLIRLKDQYVMLDNDQLQKLLKKFDKLPETLSGSALIRAGLSGKLDDASVDLSDQVKALFDQLLESNPTPLPAELKATLRPYQQRGFEWMAQNARLGFGSLLADDMGLGKTVQVISLLLHLKASGLSKQPALVVAPTSLLTNWQKELQRFAPSLKGAVYHGANRDLKSIKDSDVILTSYGLVRLDNSKLAKINWQALVLDEAQNIKNPSTLQTKAVKKLKSDIRIAMSGTPVENRLSEYWSLFDYTNKDYLGKQKYFNDTFASPIEKDRDQACLQQFRKITSPFILRRVKTDKTIIDDLPPKLESNRYCTLSAPQAALYQSTVDNIMQELESSDDMARRGLVLKLLNALKQICNSPSQFLGQKTADKAESGKLTALIELLKEADEAGEKVIIFTQYTQMGELLQKQIQAELNQYAPFLHGGLSRPKRDDMVDNFQQDNRTRIMLLSLKAAGTGLNLTAASQVIHYDLWWNPAVEAQATDRAFRIGQTKRVLVHRLITEHSFEEKIDEMIQSKKELADLTVSSGEKWVTELSNKELKELVSLTTIKS